MSQSWDLPLGTITTRKEVAARFGGAWFGGIEPSAQTPNVMIYSDPEAGRKHGYDFDGWAPGGDRYYYTGEGQDGDQEFIEGNLAIRDHLKAGRALRVFEAVKGPKKKGGKLQRYLGEFRIAAGEDGWRVQEALDKFDTKRTVLVFNLLPVDALQHTADEVEAEPPAEAPASELVPVENNLATEFDVPAQPESVALRREAILMGELQGALKAAGHEVARLKLAIPGSSTRLTTDTFDVTSQVLYEVKASATRGAVREAIGQLLDYRRFAVDVTSCAVVLPVRPAEDLVELIHSIGFELVARSGGRLVRMGPARDEPLT